MNTKQFLLDLKKQGISISVSGQDLEVSYDEALSEQVIEQITERKPAIISFLSDHEVSFEISPIPKSADYPLSAGQRRLWFLSQFEELNRAYNMPGVYELKGDLHVANLENAFQALVDRHEILRTVFVQNDDGELRQKILDTRELGFKLNYVDLSNEPDIEKSKTEIIKEHFYMLFDLKNGPLIRTTLLRTSDKEWVLICIMHHIIGDGWSLGIFVRELIDGFLSSVNKASEGLAPLNIQYKDFAVWQNAQLQSTQMSKSKNFWLNQLEGDISDIIDGLESLRKSLTLYTMYLLHRLPFPLR